jgi:uncharacterized membrane protein
MNDRKMERRLWIGLILLCLIGAAAATRRIVAFRMEPSAANPVSADLDGHFAGKEAMTMLHIVPSLVFVLLIPLQFVSRLRRRYPQVHRWSGRVIVALGSVIGISALQLSAHPVGGFVEASATTLFGCYFLFCLARAWLHIRARRVDLHRECAVRMVAIALGVATTRPVMAVFFATSRLTGLRPEQFFGPAMWIGFVATYLAGEAWIRQSRGVVKPEMENLQRA